jgi:hypothetical protein
MRSQPTKHDHRLHRQQALVLCCFVIVTKVPPATGVLRVGSGAEAKYCSRSANSTLFQQVSLAASWPVTMDSWPRRPHQGVDAERRRWRARSRICVRIAKHVGRATNIVRSGNPPYSILPYSSRYGILSQSKAGRERALVAGTAVPQVGDGRSESA